MIKNITFTSEISIETITELMEYMDACMCGTDTGLPIEKVVLNFSSPGGCYSSMILLANYLNEFPLDLEIRAFDVCYSAGLIILLHLERDLKILDTATGMFHLVDTTVQTREMRDSKSFSNFWMENAKGIDAVLIEQYALCGLSEDELKRVSDGGDVFVGAERLRECVMNFYQAVDNAMLDEEIAITEAYLSELKAQRDGAGAELTDEMIEQANAIAEEIISNFDITEDNDEKEDDTDKLLEGLKAELKKPLTTVAKENIMLFNDMGSNVNVVNLVNNIDECQKSEKESWLDALNRRIEEGEK